MSKPLLYRSNPENIRTAYMVPDRSSDLRFDAEAEPSLTQQHFKNECDINVIVRHSEKTGLLTHVNPATPRWGDFGSSVDFHTAQNYLLEAQSSFMSLPAEVRKAFDNDPAKLLDFLDDPKNESRARELGLLNPLPENNPAASLEASQGKKTPTPAESSGDE